MRKRIFRGMCGVALLCMLPVCICAVAVLYRFSFDSMRALIQDESVYIVASLNSGNTSVLDATKLTFTRITLVNPDGTVVYDNQTDVSLLDNHADRPEIIDALRYGATETQRYSDTLATRTYYRAVRLQNGQVARFSGSMDSVWAESLRHLLLLLPAMLMITLIAAAAAGRLAGRIATPLNSLDLDAPLSNDVYGELSPLLRRLEQQRVRIGEQMAEMEAHRREFETVTASMQEGLVLLGREAEILAINNSALKLWGLEAADCLGESILHFRRDEALRHAVEACMAGKAQEALLETGGKTWQLFASPVTGGGAVLLLLDVTDRRQAEQMRQEFTANVSHELKTPLTSISGFAEIIRDGVARPEDVAGFAGRIYDEASRLVALVEDILRLSHLDEKSGELAMEPVELSAVCRKVAERLGAAAGEKGVTIRVEGSAPPVTGSPAVLEEMVENLCDNAVKYNREGGRVDILVRQEDGEVRLTVSDTGIGIPAEHHDRVFERFYRVDKSHSRQTGGTGLGLSIVKRGAILHGARLELRSEPDRGTAICIAFPLPAEAESV